MMLYNNVRKEISAYVSDNTSPVTTEVDTYCTYIKGVAYFMLTEKCQCKCQCMGLVPDISTQPCRCQYRRIPSVYYARDCTRTVNYTRMCNG